MKQVSINSLPECLKIIPLVFPESVEVYECADLNEIIAINEMDPLEMTVINQTKNGVVERHFYVGVALDLDMSKPAAEIKPPRFYFAQMNDKQYEKYKDIVEKKLLNGYDKIIR